MWQLYKLRLSAGEIVELCHAVAQAGQTAVAEIKAAIVASPQVYTTGAVGMDETGWREDGDNGYVWASSTPQGLRAFEFHFSRAGADGQRLRPTCVSPVVPERALCIKLNFTWGALDGAATALNRLRAACFDMGEPGEDDEAFIAKFTDQINDDLNLPRAMAVTWELVRSDLPPATKKATLLRFDRVLDWVWLSGNQRRRLP